MKAKVTLFKVHVKEASHNLSVDDIFDWDILDQCVPHCPDIRYTTGEAVLDDLSAASTRDIYFSVN